VATDRDFIACAQGQFALCERLPNRRRLRKRMLGEYALSLEAKVVAFGCNSNLLLKSAEAGRALTSRVTGGRSCPGAKAPCVVAEYLDDTSLLQALFQATADAPPALRMRRARPKLKPESTPNPTPGLPE
jgi:TfoX/Sxy family transcriptional regulator of competence genes